MKWGPLEKIDVIGLTRSVQEDWSTIPLLGVNDHIVRVGVLDGDYHWHAHQGSDELFYVIQGKLELDLEDRTETLGSGQMIMVPAGTRHRSRSGMRTVMLCFETEDTNVVGDMGIQ